jgi:hypothetical protein
MIRLPLRYRTIAALRAVVGNRRANVAVEFALAAPAIFMFLFGIIDLGYTLWLQNALDGAVASAARCASLNRPGCGSSSISSYIASWGGAAFDSSSLTVNYTPNYTSVSPYTSSTAPSGSTNCGCLVTATYPISLGIPWADFAVTLSSQACYAPPPKGWCTS